MSSNRQTIEIDLGKMARPTQWIALGLGSLFLLAGFGDKEFGWLIAACFLGIVARIAQAEHQHGEILARGAAREPAP